MGNRTPQSVVVLLVITISVLMTALLFGQAVAADSLHSVAYVPRTVGDPLPRIQCTNGYTATIYAESLSSPDGLAFDPDGVLHVAEETAGRVSRIESNGSVTTVLSGLTKPEGIAFDDAGNLYVVEDGVAGRLVKRESNGMTTTLATNFDAPEGVVAASDGMLYVSESNLQFETNPFALATRIAAVSSTGAVTRILTSTPQVVGLDVMFWSYAGITLGRDGLLYVSNELSGVSSTVGPVTLFTTDSIFTVDPATGARSLFASDLITPEGLRFSAGGGFPLYVAEENIGAGAGRLTRVQSDGSHAPFCTGFLKIEDVVLDPLGRLYVSEDGSGMIIRIELTNYIWLPIILRQA